MEPKDLQVVILAGGKGTRLLPMTRHIPKFLVTIAGYPFADHLFVRLCDVGFRKYLVIAGHLSEMVERWGKPRGVDVFVEPEPRSKQHAIELAYSRLDDAFLLVNGDTLIELDWDKFLDNPLNTMAVVNAVDAGYWLVEKGSAVISHNFQARAFYDIGTPEGYFRTWLYLERHLG